jgi:hypothetical protein
LSAGLDHAREARRNVDLPEAQEVLVVVAEDLHHVAALVQVTRELLDNHAIYHLPSPRPLFVVVGRR